MGSNKNLEDTLLQAMDIIASRRVATANYDKTIQANIVSCVDSSAGKYRVKYQDSVFFAYANNTEQIYEKGDAIYVLIPNGDMKKEKAIIGKIKGGLSPDRIKNIKYIKNFKQLLVFYPSYYEFPNVPPDSEKDMVFVDASTNDMYVFGLNNTLAYSSVGIANNEQVFGGDSTD